MRLIGMLSVACLTLLLTIAADERLLLANANVHTSYQLPSQTVHSLYGLEGNRHSNPFHLLTGRNAQKTTERQSSSTSFLPVSDSIYASSFALNKHYYRQYDAEISIRVKQHYESNLIYRFIHSRHKTYTA